MREIYIDSRRRNEPYGNAYTLFIQNPPLKNITKVDLVAATIPNTMYNITNGTDIFSISGENISVENGFYSAGHMINAINLNLTGTMKCVFLSEEGKFMFVDNNPFTLEVFSDEFSLITGFSKELLYSQNTGLVSKAYEGKYYIKSQNVANFKTYGEYVYLDIDELRRPYNIDAVSNVYNSQSSTIFAIVPMDVSSGCIKTFKEQTDYKISVEYPKQIDQIDRLTIVWRDFKGNVINFNGVDENSLILRFHEMEKEYFVEEKPKEKPLFQFENKRDVKFVFIIMFISIVFILFIKRR